MNDVQKDIEENGRNNDNKESETYYKNLYYYRSREEKFNALTPEQRERYRELADLGTANPIKERVAFGNISMFKAWENLFKQIGSLPDAHAVKQELKNAGVYDPDILEFATSLSNVSRNSKNLYESQQFAAKHPFASNFMTVLTGPEDSLNAEIDTTINAVREAVTGEYRPVDRNNVWHQGIQKSQVIRQDSKAAAEKTYPFTNPISGQNAAGEVYDGVMNFGDWLLELLYSGGKHPAISTGIGALNTGGKAAEDTLRRGGTAGQALQSALAFGGIDAAFSLPLFKGSPGLGKAIGWNLGGQVVGNTARDRLDRLIMGNQSQYELDIQNKMNRGLSREEAENEKRLEDIRQYGSLAPFVTALFQSGTSWAAKRTQPAAESTEDPMSTRKPFGEGKESWEEAARRMAGVEEPEEMGPKKYTDWDLEIMKEVMGDSNRNRPFTDQEYSAIITPETPGANIAKEMLRDNSPSYTFDYVKQITSTLPDYAKERLDAFNQSHPDSPDVTPEVFAVARAAANHQSLSKTVVLGKYLDGGPESYIAKAGKTKAYFDMGAHYEEFQKTFGFSDGDMFDLFNKQFLDDGIRENKTFYFVHDPMEYGGALREEYNYLLNSDYEKYITKEGVYIFTPKE